MTTTRDRDEFRAVAVLGAGLLRDLPTCSSDRERHDDNDDGHHERGNRRWWRND